MQERLEIISPVDGSVYWQGAYADDAAVDAALVAASQARGAWAATAVEQRISTIRPFVEAVERRADQFAQLISWQMGRPLHLANETEVFVDLANFYLSDAERALTDERLPGTDHEQRLLCHEPYGLCLSICAWNYPMGMAASEIIAPLVAGNVVLFKHAPQVARIGALLQECAIEASLPHGVFQAIQLTHGQAERVLASGLVRGLFFIGSTRGGFEVRRAASSQLVYEHLELGGSDPAYVAEDADIDATAKHFVSGGFSNAGQSCCSVERVFVADAIADRFIEALAANVAKEVTVDHPIDKQPMIGPLVSAQAAERVRGLIEDGVRSGARAILPEPAHLRELPGTAYVAPQILIDAEPEMSIVREEIFGPVVTVQRVKSDTEAVLRMNASAFGLTSSVWTQDLRRGEALCRLLEAGVTYVNRCDYVDELIPWGGRKGSGLGRMDGLSWARSVTEPKGIYIRRL